MLNTGHLLASGRELSSRSRSVKPESAKLTGLSALNIGRPRPSKFVRLIASYSSKVLLELGDMRRAFK